jgi:hypothetical protein
VFLSNSAWPLSLWKGFAFPFAFPFTAQEILRLCRRGEAQILLALHEKAFGVSLDFLACEAGVSIKPGA